MPILVLVRPEYASSPFDPRSSTLPPTVTGKHTKPAARGPSESPARPPAPSARRPRRVSPDRRRTGRTLPGTAPSLRPPPVPRGAPRRTGCRSADYSATVPGWPRHGGLPFARRAGVPLFPQGMDSNAQGIFFPLLKALVVRAQHAGGEATAPPA